MEKEVRSVFNRPGLMKAAPSGFPAPSRNDSPAKTGERPWLQRPATLRQSPASEKPSPHLNAIVARAIANLKDKINPKDPDNRKELVGACFTLIHDNCEKFIDKKQMPADQALRFKYELGRLAWATGMPGEPNRQGVFVPKGAGSGANPLLNPLKDLLHREHPDILSDKRSRETTFDLAEKKITAFVEAYMTGEECQQLRGLQRGRAALEEQWQSNPPAAYATVRPHQLRHTRTFLQ